MKREGIFSLSSSRDCDICLTSKRFDGEENVYLHARIVEGAELLLLVSDPRESQHKRLVNKNVASSVDGCLSNRRRRRTGRRKAKAETFHCVNFCRWQRGASRWLMASQGWKPTHETSEEERVKNCCRFERRTFFDKNWLKVFTRFFAQPTGTLVDCGNFHRLQNWLGGGVRGD